MSDNTKVTNPELLEAIEQMQADNNPDTVNYMIDCVMEAKFITPGLVSKPRNIAKTDKNGATVMQQETQVQFQLIENNNKEKFFPAFTDDDEKNKWDGAKGRDNVIMTFDSYAQVLGEQGCEVMGFVINPFGKSVAFPKPMVISLKQQKDNRASDGLTKQEIKNDEKVEFGDPDPDEYPIDMMAAMINYLKERDDVHKAFLRTFRRENDDKPSYMVIVDLSGNKMEEIFRGVSMAASPHLGDYQLSMIPYSVPFAKKAVEDTEPFYDEYE